ncbi:hypothetical protein GUITHDRAFT_114817 [Guillardia theta CCMP2712]|uniref:SMP-30/Gluconolactonase/LRE-like region domain-containing protein n=1 Tax=Guillardia theta (strain CCMP2712) TaxID=905079 RepID=L1ITJ8_GUITC|nr:hypothetical protein GUITHDRAFT_114817 [Guillardia theta CCMP2712]EKX39160.1 hypothetical protein GUITHDRAFT_114817 [Guillardia theta CCMP2712]|eukprot:XP_005826140.1 hypothetical protein GUITHDRAFT_114817 [Guillardia theta CCMP2712]
MKVDEIFLVATSYAGRFQTPCHVALDKLGNIFSSDASSETIRVYRGQDGTLISKIRLKDSLKDQSPSTVKCIQGLVLDDEENIYVVDGFNHRILLLRSDGSLVRELGVSEDGRPMLSFPKGIDLADGGFIYVADAGNKRVVVMDRGGRFVRDIQSPQEMCNPCAVCVDEIGFVYVADAGLSSVFVFDVDGELINEFDGSSVLAISECRRHSEMFFEASEYEGAHVGENKLVCPLSITLGNDGLLYICDEGAHDIKVFTKQGHFVKKIGRHEFESCARLVDS